MINRKKETIIHANTLVNELKNENLLSISKVDLLQKMMKLKEFATNLEQIVWALNSNKEHIKYVIKVFYVPEQFQRIESSSNPNSIICLRNSIIETINHCSETIFICRFIRERMKQVIIKSFLDLNSFQPNQPTQF